MDFKNTLSILIISVTILIDTYLVSQWGYAILGANPYACYVLGIGILLILSMGIGGSKLIRTI